ncbi:site-specific DNA-methyltransferase [Pseudomonas putida]|uniref:site-specific DNA-methyltransferase n=1 Tax=Pseudomonas putida TaxID=303 RepID=UPI001F5D5B42|nr:site-specific DNA-methyltransferase [Pseudomonas putida]
MNKPVMDQVTLQDGESVNIVSENIEQLKTIFPEAFSEGGFNFDTFRQLLGDGGIVEEGEEKYGLNWHGKKKARQIALTPSTGTLLPCPNESSNWDITKNIFVEGDNLEVLKLLQKGYAGKIKMIYIDPPYNTGRDFVYPDTFQDSISNYLEQTGQVEGGLKRSTNTETNGRFHTDWLNMIYPRLNLARRLLRDDGVILVSIDDAEFPNLRRVMDEVFGEENFLATLVWDRNRKNDAKYFSVGHEYMAVYAKNESALSENKVIFRGEKDGIEEIKEEFRKLEELYGADYSKVRDGVLEFYKTIQDDDPRAPLKRFTKIDEKGPYRDDGNINWPGGDGPRYEVIHPITKLPCKLPVSGWRYPNPDRFWEEVEKGRVVFGIDEKTVPRVRTNLFENTDQVMVSVHYSYAQTSANEFISLFDGARVFDNPKPVTDLRRLTGYLTGPDDLVCDFFAGSGTTGQAVMAQNAADGGNRRFILVQLPEPLDPQNKDQKNAADFCKKIKKPLTIAEITKERLRRAGEKVKKDNVGFDGDTGFKVFRLSSSNIKLWNPDRADLEETLLSHQEHLVDGRTQQDILYELLIKRGIDLAAPIESKVIFGKEVYSIGYGALFACLDENIKSSDVEAVAQGILKWYGELNPISDVHVFFRDSAFTDDVVKTNMAAILYQNGITHVRSL